MSATSSKDGTRGGSGDYAASLDNTCPSSIATDAPGPDGGDDGTGNDDTTADNTPAINTINLMDLAEDQLASMFRPLTLEYGSLAYFAWVKLINRRMANLVRNEMKNAVYQACVHALAFLVPGTLIPCGAAAVLPVPVPVDWDETWDIFADNMQLAPNALEVGGIFRYHAGFFTASRELEETDDAYRHFLLLVQIDYYAPDIYDPALESHGPHDVADLQFLPNNIRSAMDHLGLNVSYDSLEQTEMGDYFRFLRVREDTTMQEVFDAVSFAEGWTMPVFNMRIADTDIGADVTVVASSEMLEDEQWRLVINWPKLSIEIGHVAVGQPFIQTHTTIDMHQGPVSESGEGERVEGEAAGWGDSDLHTEMPLAPDPNVLGELQYDTATRQWSYANID